MPRFQVDLDLPPEERWVKVVKHYKNEILAMHKALGPILVNSLGATGMKEWLAIEDQLIDPEQKREIEGMTKALGQENSENHRQLFKFTNLLYEVAMPSACSGVLWARKDGTVYHGRNMDYSFNFEMPDGRILNWNDVTFDNVFYKDKKPLFISTGWPGLVGITTGMRYDGWAVQQNMRPGNDWRDNLAAAKQGGKAMILYLRRLLETTGDYDTAVSKLYNEKFVAPMYFTLSGKGPYEGAVLTIDRLGYHMPNSPPIEKLSSTGWHLVQTNDDMTSMPADPRRPVANVMLKDMTQDIVNETNLMRFMHTPILYDGETVFSTVMVPATGFFKTELPNESPSPQDSWAAAKGGSGDLSGMSPSQRERRKFLYKDLGKLAYDFERGGDTKGTRQSAEDWASVQGLVATKGLRR